MWAFRVLSVALTLVAWLVIPITLVTTFVLGILVRVTFGLFLLPISLIWVVCFLGPLLALSWVWEKVPLLRIPNAVIGIPVAFAGNTYACLMPSMGELDSRVSKLLLSESWPYTLDCWRLITNKSIPKSPGAENLCRILTELSESPPNRQFLESIDVWVLLSTTKSSQESEPEKTVDEALFELAMICVHPHGPLLESIVDSELESWTPQQIDATHIKTLSPQHFALSREAAAYAGGRLCQRVKGRMPQTERENRIGDLAGKVAQIHAHMMRKEGHDQEDIDAQVDADMEYTIRKVI